MDQPLGISNLCSIHHVILSVGCLLRRSSKVPQVRTPSRLGGAETESRLAGENPGKPSLLLRLCTEGDNWRPADSRGSGERGEYAAFDTGLFVV
jgi:hypothetical protein